jgi:hypothetical protein
VIGLRSAGSGEGLWPAVRCFGCGAPTLTVCDLMIMGQLASFGLP